MTPEAAHHRNSNVTLIAGEAGLVTISLKLELGDDFATRLDRQQKDDCGLRAVAADCPGRQS